MEMLFHTKFSGTNIEQNPIPKCSSGNAEYLFPTESSQDTIET